MARRVRMSSVRFPQRKCKSPESHWAQLPSELLHKVLGFLFPVELGCCRAVCKTWSQTLEHVVHPPLAFVAPNNGYLENCFVLNYKMTVWIPLDMSFLHGVCSGSTISRVASHGGLLCLIIENKETRQQSFVVCNPLKRTWVQLPENAVNCLRKIVEAVAPAKPPNSDRLQQLIQVIFKEDDAGIYVPDEGDGNDSDEVDDGDDCDKGDGDDSDEEGDESDDCDSDDDDNSDEGDNYDDEDYDSDVEGDDFETSLSLVVNTTAHAFQLHYRNEHWIDGNNPCTSDGENVRSNDNMKCYQELKYYDTGAREAAVTTWVSAHKQHPKWDTIYEVADTAFAGGLYYTLFAHYSRRRAGVLIRHFEFKGFCLRWCEEGFMDSSSADSDDPRKLEIPFAESRSYGRQLVVVKERLFFVVDGSSEEDNEDCDILDVNVFELKPHAEPPQHVKLGKMPSLYVEIALEDRLVEKHQEKGLTGGVWGATRHGDCILFHIWGAKRFLVAFRVPDEGEIAAPSSHKEIDESWWTKVPSPRTRETGDLHVVTMEFSSLTILPMGSYSAT